MQGNNGEVDFEVNNDRYLRDSYTSKYLKISGLSGQDVGQYTIEMSLVDIKNTIWNTGVNSLISKVWKITPKILTVPTVTGTYVFTGLEQTCTFDNFDTALMTVTGDKATTAGKHVATFDIKDKKNMVWADGTTTSQQVAWYISAITVDPAILSIHDANFTYDGQEHQITSDNITGFSDIFKLEGQLKGTAVNTYYAKVYLKDSSTYEWKGDKPATESVDLAWSIQKRVMQIPTIAVPNTEYTYNGNQVTITADECNFGIPEDKNFIVIKDNTGTNAGDYTLKFSIDPNHVANCTWQDNTIVDKTATWKINKAYIASWTTNKTSVDITGEPESYVDITVNRPGNGEVKASTSSQYISVTVLDAKSDKPIIRIKDENGPVKTIVTVKIDDGDNYYSSSFSNAHHPTSCPISLDINVSDLTRRLPSAFTPDRIQEIVREGFAATIWQIGDKIPIAFNSFTLSGQGNDYIPAGTYDAVILGFNHNKDKENATVDYTMTVAVMYQHDSTIAIAFFDRSINTPYDCFAGQYYDNVYNAISESWRDIIVTTKKYDSTSAKDSKVFNLSCFEVYGGEGPGKGISQDWSDGRQKQYDYFKQVVFPTTVKPQYNTLGDKSVHVSSRSRGKGDGTDKTVISFLTQTGNYYRSEQQDWLPYGYSDWCETPLSYHTTDYVTNIQTGMIPCFNIG